MAATDTYDYIVVGAGSAGCVLANRLSGDSSRRVLLIEAGGKDRNILFRLPMLMGKLFQSGIYNWHYHTEPESSLNGRSLFWPRGKVLGGSSTINGMIYVRGNRRDYDNWAQRGLPGWSYDAVLPAFLRSEGHTQRAGIYHNSDGELTVCRARGRNVLLDVFCQAGKEAGYPVNDDFNDAEQDGVGRYDFTIRRGMRWSASSAFLRPVLKRPNLTVLTHALAERVVVKAGRAIGVDVSHNGSSHRFHANDDVILSAGTVNSPHLLLLSGIGPEGEIRSHGITPVHHLPGVGKNLQDHVDCVMSWECTKPVTLFADLRADKLALSIVQGLVWGKGIVTTFPYEAGAFLRSREGLDAPDVQLHFMPALERTANLNFPRPFRRQSAEINHGFTLRVGPAKPESRGEVILRSANPLDAPRVFGNYLLNDVDLQTMIRGIRLTRTIIDQNAFSPFRGRELAPGRDVTSDGALEDWLRASAMTTFHPVGTCKMGVDELAVVDAKLRVHGLRGLRVADASIMPVITSGNTNAPAIMIGEKCAEFVLQQGTGGRT